MIIPKNRLPIQNKNAGDLVTYEEWNRVVNQLKLQTDFNSDLLNSLVRYFKFKWTVVEDEYSYSYIELLDISNIDETLNSPEEVIDYLDNNGYRAQEYAYWLVKYHDYYIHSHILYNSLLSLTGEYVVDDETTNINHNLLHTQDITFTKEVTSVSLTIPDDCEHGYFAGVTFKIGENPLTVDFNNLSNYPLKKIKYGGLTTELITAVNKTISLSFHCDGLNVYCYYIEV